MFPGMRGYNTVSENISELILRELKGAGVVRKKHQTTQELWEAPVFWGAWEVSIYGEFLLLVTCA